MAKRNRLPGNQKRARNAGRGLGNRWYWLDGLYARREEIVEHLNRVMQVWNEDSKAFLSVEPEVLREQHFGRYVEGMIFELEQKVTAAQNEAQKVFDERIGLLYGARLSKDLETYIPVIVQKLFAELDYLESSYNHKGTLYHIGMNAE
jgi:uncharacterized protein YcgL (UPF0745 family)